VGTLTFSSGSGSGSGLALARNATPNAPFNADVALTLNVIDSDAVAFAGNPASVGAATAGNGIPFNNGNAMRFGRLRLFNASGSQLIAMPISIQAQYWNGTAFVTNTADSCTTLAAANVALGNYQRNLNAGETTVSVGGVFNAGVGTLRLSAPGTANNGSVDVSVNLTAGTAGTSCTGGMPATTGSSLSHLQGAWCGASYNRDPTARATFGVYRNSDQLIYQRENF
jgi:MSHA biogenesis protein MshQ